MGQINLFNDSLANTGQNKIINVSKVPQRSPFRYPGGKTWLIPWVRKWIKSLDFRPQSLIEPFAGGGIVSLTIAFENLAENILMVELDDQVAAVWRTIFGEDRVWLANRIGEFELSYDSAMKTISRTPENIREKAFQTILKNRIYHGGILANGSGMLKHGENGKGITSRWYPETLKKRILNIGFVEHKIRFLEGDGIDVVRQYSDRDDIAYFIDPPYTAGGKKAGRRLYRHYDINHEELFDILGGVKGDFLMTYDDAEEVRRMAEARNFDVVSVSMKGTHHNELKELLIGRNLSWAGKRDF